MALTGGRGWFAAMALALMGACAAPDQAEPGFAADLGFDADPASANFGELRLAVPAAGREWTAAERSELETSVNELQPELLAAVVIWTGAVSQVEDECHHPADQPAILGRVAVASRGLVFEPRFPWVAGMNYTACLDAGRLAEELGLQQLDEAGVRTLMFLLPAPSGQPPRVTAVWPEVEEIPANLLRFYVHFDQPMHRRGVAGHVRLLDATGEAIVEPFVEIPEGLWDPDGRRLTLFVHPGRIKRSVGPRKVLGAALTAGESVTFEVGAQLETARGIAVGEPIRVAYRVVEADRTVPNPDRWQLQLPTKANDALRLEFDESLDRAQIATAVLVLREGESARAVSVPGRAAVEAGGRAWSFTPMEPWRAGEYRLEVARGLEDLAGNTLDRLFDVETTDLPSAAVEVIQPSDPRGSVLSFEFTVELTGD